MFTGLLQLSSVPGLITTTRKPALIYDPQLTLRSSRRAKPIILSDYRAVMIMTCKLACGVNSVQGGPNSKSLTDLSINRFIRKKGTVILHVHQLGNDRILYQVVCAASSIKCSMIFSSRIEAAVRHFRHKRVTMLSRTH